jgi:hypothetical protein
MVGGFYMALLSVALLELLRPQFRTSRWSSVVQTVTSGVKLTG